jgi:drug/metabolite transporter (DMT)-like permease
MEALPTTSPRSLGIMTHSSRDLRGILFALATFTFWVLADTSIKLVGRSSLPAYEILAFLGLSVSAAIVLYAVLRREIKRLKPVHIRHQAVRSMLDLINNFCVVVALRHISLPLFYILVFMAPLVVTLLAATFLYEKIGLGRVIAAITGFAGVVIAVNPFSASRQGDWIGFLACMVCVACFSVNMVWSRVLTRTETPESLAFFTGIVMIVVGSACMLFHAQPVSGPTLLALLAMGVFCAAGSLCFFAALKLATASTVSQYHYTQLLTGSLVSWLVWRQLPTLSMILGGTLIVAAGIYVALPRPTPRT